MSEPIFTNLQIRVRSVEGPMSVEADVDCSIPGVNGNDPDSGTAPYVTIDWDDPASSPDILLIGQARRLAAALIRCADHAERARDEAMRRGWKLEE
jgi:hypothetical protein